MAGTATQYQPPFHRIIYLAAAASTPTTDRTEDRPRSVALGNPRRAPRGLLGAASALSLQSAASRRSGRIGFSSSVVSPELVSPPVVSRAPISLREVWECVRATSLNVSESFASARATGE